MFGELNNAQWLWYFYNFLEDRKESFEHDRDMVEYQASFVEPEAVRKIREARDESVKVPDKEFIAGIEYFFGRKINLPDKPQSGTVSSTMDPRMAEGMSNSYKQAQVQAANPARAVDSRHWLNLDLE